MKSREPLQIIKQWGKRNGKPKEWFEAVEFLWWVRFEFIPKELSDQKKKQIQK